MIHGSFTATGEPVVSAAVWLRGDPAQPFVGRASLQFLVDTGSFCTIISDKELIRFGIIPQAYAEYKRKMSGLAVQVHMIGNHSIPGIPIHADLYFADGRARRKPRRLVKHAVDLLVVERNETVAHPNILGRDVLRHWRMVHCPSQPCLTAEPQSWGEILAVPTD